MVGHMQYLYHVFRVKRLNNRTLIMRFFNSENRGINDL
jgi:hypothetical protein